MHRDNPRGRRGEKTITRERKLKKKRQEAQSKREKKENRKREKEERERREEEMRAKEEEERKKREEAMRRQQEQISSFDTEDSEEEQEQSDDESSSSSENDEGGERAAALAQKEPEQPWKAINSAPTLDEVRSSLAVLRSESLTNATRLEQLQELTTINTETLQKVVAHIQRDAASTSTQDQTTLIPLSVPVDHITQKEMRDLDQLLEKVANYTSDFNNITKQAVINMRRSLAAFKFRADVEITNSTAASDIVDFFDAKVKAMAPTDV
ncbi:GRB10-interacting GYF protein 2-like [Cynara cardunculus var. scolymus]|uniref:GRB10-interacting GYF protein 2-like n=1 Tax=Cynara cardunculus var. scolymus TaxID=59895 RepID=UPI000D62E69C|nr:GRB10-interacting GYF protein 2-like [Cynara cardunculus var. scolymus]